MKGLHELNKYNTNAFDKVLVLTVVISSILILTIASMVSVSVISRYIFGKPIAWVIEISEYILLWSTFVAAAWVFKEDGHIKIDLVVNHLPPLVKDRIEYATQILGLLLFAVITIYGLSEVHSVYERGIAAVGMLRVPKYLLLLSIPCGSLLLMIQFIRAINSRFINSKYMKQKIKILNGFL